MTFSMPRVGELDVGVGDAVLVHLLGDQVPARDRLLLLERVAGEADDLHAVEKRRLDRVEHVGRRDEEDLREVVGNGQVVVAEGEVLLRVEHLEQRRRGVAAVVGADLVDLVEHEDGVRRAGLVDALDDAARHGADVRPAVAADLGLVAHAAEREPHELAVEGPGDRSAERGLADARRSDEAEDRPLETLLQGVDREELEDPLLDLLDVVVVLVQDLAGPLDVLRVVRTSGSRAAPSSSRGTSG